MNEANQKPEPQKLQKVVLKKPHEHAGRNHDKGVTIEVNEADVKWLEDNEVIEKASATPGAAPIATDTKAAQAKA